MVVGNERTRRDAGSNDGNGRRAKPLASFPGIKVPVELSLLHQTLKALAVDFEWHVEFDHTYLWAIPIHIKSLLLSYIVKYGSNEGISVSSLHALFSSQQIDGLSEATGNEGLTRLDLSGSIGRALSLKGLNGYWLRNKTKDVILDTPDTWDSIPVSPSSRLRFPTLTHLSLAYPGPTVSWTDLLTFSHHLGAVTHLSLAHWPTPRLPTVATVAPAAAINIAPDDNCADAAHIIKQLSRHTPSLTYLCLDGCPHWWRALRQTLPPAKAKPRVTRRYEEQFTSSQTPATSLSPQAETRNDAPPTASNHSSPSDSIIDWTTTWRHIAHLSLTQSPLPPANINLAFLSTLHKARGHSSVPNSVRVSGMLLWRSREEAEAYRIVAPVGSGVGSSVRESMEARERRREWCEGEVEAVQVESFVGGLRVRSGKACGFEHGWGREELVEVGYDEGLLFAAGF